MLTRIITTALFAGFIAGIIAAILQFLLVQPLLLHAELFEGGDLTHFGATGAGTPAQVAWSGFDPMRDLLSLVFTALIYTGYGFLLVAAIAFAADRGIVRRRFQPAALSRRSRQSPAAATSDPHT